MSDDLNLHKDMDLAAQAKALLENELLNNAFDQLETDYIQFWRENTALNDVDGRERLWQAVNLVGKVRAHLKAAVENGKLAEYELRHLAQGGRN